MASFLERTECALTPTSLHGGITVVSGHTVLTVPPLRVVQALQTLATRPVAAAGDVGVDVVVADTRLTCAPFCQRVAEVIVDTAVTGRRCEGKYSQLGIYGPNSHTGTESMNNRRSLRPRR